MAASTGAGDTFSYVNIGVDDFGENTSTETNKTADIHMYMHVVHKPQGTHYRASNMYINHTLYIKHCTR